MHNIYRETQGNRIMIHNTFTKSSGSLKAEYEDV